MKRKNIKFSYGSVCSGIEAATVAWHRLGWTPAWFSEIEPFPCSVLSHHYPTIPNLGDMTKLHETEVFNDRAIDLLVGGTPCQSFSVAGLRKGLDDPRGNLALVFLAILNRKRPRWVVWENVPGVLSSWSDEAEDSDCGRWQSNDFDTFLCGLRELGYGFAWRVLDAQYFGVPQRRRRVFVVGHFGDWRPAAAVLFERHSVSWNPAPCRKAGEGTAAPAAPSLTASGRGVERTGESRGQDPVVAATVTSKWAKGTGGPAGNECGNLVSHTLNARHDSSEDGCGRGTPIVPVVIEQNTQASTPKLPSLRALKTPNTAVAVRTAQTSSNGKGINEEGQAYTLDGAQGQAVAVPIDMRNATRDPEKKDELNRQGCGIGNEGDPAPTVSTAHVPAVAFTQNQVGDVLTGEVMPSMGTNQNATGRNTPKVAITDMRGNGDGNTSPTLTKSGSGDRPHDMAPMLRSGMQVRRLTPRECERLQGFPDDYTLIPVGRRNKKAEQKELSDFARKTGQDDIKWSADGPRYKALGNSMAVPVMHWIGKRIMEFEK